MRARKPSAGLLMYRRQGDELEVLVVHPGGPFFRNKDEGAWSIPKGEVDGDEDLLSTARREFKEETGVDPSGPFLPLGQVRQAGGKVVHAWAFEGDLDPGLVRSNQVTMAWPPRSGKTISFPEVDRAEFCRPADAKRKLNPAQSHFVDVLCRALDQLF